jgi:hypothetical protein
MNEHDFGSGATPQKRNTQGGHDDKIQYSLRAEEQLLQSISARAPLPKVLNEICSALDSEIGNVVSLITLPADDPSEVAAIAMKATLFGLYSFCSEGVPGENDEVLGFLEMYSCAGRKPNVGEIQLIERAKCLAAIAIQRQDGTSHRDDRDQCGNRTIRGSVVEWPVSTVRLV